ncbi:hypothetical protein Tcan_18914 [Toxocara canis]|uniref:Uncharacterized protein n=1 Tax=Toxocara canis TaxID=6265 RepID=A0A0B2UN65_TOXCA|nr:hypothetical protein Tcan_18914 [Toxocara canis]
MSSFAIRAFNRCCCFCARKHSNDDNKESKVKAAITHTSDADANNVEKRPPPQAQRSLNWQLDLSTIFSESLDFTDENCPPPTTVTPNSEIQIWGSPNTESHQSMLEHSCQALEVLAEYLTQNSRQTDGTSVLAHSTSKTQIDRTQPAKILPNEKVSAVQVIWDDARNAHFSVKQS